MRRLHSLAACLLLLGLLVHAPAHAALGPNAGVCARGGPALLVEVAGLKNRAGKVRVRAYTDPAHYFERGHEVSWIEVPTPRAGPVAICVPVRPGVYALDVRHDVNGNGKTDWSDGIGLSGNPQLSVLDVVFKRRPPARVVQVAVGRGVVAVPIVVKYRG